MEIYWTGPFSWPGYELDNGLQSVPKLPGIYLQTVDYRNGYLIHAAGLTRRTVYVRFREHTRQYFNGEYNVFDIAAMQRGVRKEVWHGWGWSPQKRAEFEERKAAIHSAVHKQLAGFRIFVADVGTEPRILERLEASIMGILYQASSPICDIPDKGMMLAPRWDSEALIAIENRPTVLLHGLPAQFEI